MLVTEGEIVTLFREEQLMNAQSPILVTPSGMTRSVTSVPFKYRFFA